MSEFDPSSPDFIDRLPMLRFETDMHYAQSFYDLYSAFTTYLMNQLDLSEDAAMQLYSEVSAQLPDAELFEEDATLAQQQMRLGLVRVVLPLAEGAFGFHSDFSAWVRHLARSAMDTAHGSHDVDDCVVAPKGVTEFSCDRSDNCPVKVVKYTLIEDCMMPDFQSMDYQGEWAYGKIKRSLAKLNAAQALGLIVGHEASTIRSSYILRTKARAPFTPENGDI